jgi:hypothetical protein
MAQAAGRRDRMPDGARDVMLYLMDGLAKFWNQVLALYHSAVFHFVALERQRQQR